MMKGLKKYDQYVKGTLTEVELESFTKEIVKDHFEKEELQDKWDRILQEEHKILKTPESPSKTFSLRNSARFIKIGLYSAASILLLLLSWFVYQSLSLPAYEKLLSEELNKPYVENISRKGSIEELRLQAVASYNSREYAVAAKHFEQLSKMDEAVDWPFYVGLCQLYQKQSNLAIKSFSAILDHPNQNYSTETNWYLGLAYVMNEDFESAIKHLEFVANRSNDEMAWKVKEAKELLNLLKEDS